MSGEAKEQLLNLVDQMVQDIIETPIEELETEIRMRGEDPVKIAARMREVLSAALVVHGKKPAQEPRP